MTHLGEVGATLETERGAWRAAAPAADPQLAVRTERAANKAQQFTLEAGSGALTPTAATRGRLFPTAGFRQ